MNSAGNSSIDCAAARRHLSAYHDGELAPSLRAAMRDHIESCLECSQCLRELQKISRTAAELTTPEVPTEVWLQIEKKLGEDTEGKLDRLSLLKSFVRGHKALLSAVAAILFGISTLLGVWGFHSSDHEHGHVAVSFGQYLDEFRRNPVSAEQLLLSEYDGRAVSFDEATRQVRYRPIAPKSLPDGASLEALYLLKMPCCLCVQAVYGRAGGEGLSLFEHVDDQPIWFGNRPTIHARCNGVPTSIVQVDEFLAASWMRHGRCVTLVGAHDLEQVVQVMAFLDRQ